MIARSALWAPATTPIEPARTRRYLRPRGYTVGLVVIALIGALLSFATDSIPQLAVAIAVLVAVAIDALHGVPQRWSARSSSSRPGRS